MYREKTEKIAHMILQQGEYVEDQLKMLEDLIDKCSKYVSLVNELEIARMTSRLYMEGDDYRQQHIEHLDLKRSKNHDSLITVTRIINRLCEKIGTEPLYKGDLENRVEIANFGFNIASELFGSRKL